MIAGQDQYMIRLLVFQEKEILIDRVGGALVPIFADPLLGRDGGDIFTQLGIENVPSRSNMPVQGMGFVLDQDGDLAKAGIEAVAQREIDDPIFAAERDGRL